MTMVALETLNVTKIRYILNVITEFRSANYVFLYTGNSSDFVIIIKLFLYTCIFLHGIT